MERTATENSSIDNFYSVCKKKYESNKKPAKKNIPVSVLKSLSKITLEETSVFLTTYSNILTRIYRKKSALHWASDNKNVQVLESVLNFFIENNFNIHQETLADKNIDYPINISYYNFINNKLQSFLLSSSYGIPLFKKDCSSSLIYNNPKCLLKHTFIGSEIEKENFSKYINDVPSEWKINPLNLSFWCQNKNVIQLVFSNDFIEKKDWISQLKKEIKYFFSCVNNKQIIYDSIIFYLADHLFLNDLFELLNFGISFSHDKKEDYQFIFDSLNLFFSSRYQYETFKFNEYIIHFFNKNNFNQWFDFNNKLNEYKITDQSLNPSNNYFVDINKLYLSYILHRDLNNNSNKKEISKI